MMHRKTYNTWITVGTLFLVLLSGCTTNSKLASRYCFHGRTRSPVGDSYTLSTFYIGSDSSFELIDKFYGNKREKRLDKPWKTENAVGYLRIKSDTIYSIVKSPDQQHGNSYIFYIKKNHLVFLDHDEQPLQKWKRCAARP
jgi:hypothetical protein